MAIQIKNDSIFILETQNTHYVFTMNKSGKNRHLYWGKKLPVSDYSEDIRDAYFGGEGQEYTVFGGMMYRDSDLKVEFSDACRELDVCFSDAEIKGNELAVRLSDKHYPIDVILKYTVNDDDDIITRWAEIVNRGSEPITLERVFSAEVTLPSVNPYFFKNANGGWCGEYEETECRLSGGAWINDSKSGASGHSMSPHFIAYQNADERGGEVYFGALAYSGNFKITAFRDNAYVTHVQLGINDHDFRWILKGGETFVTPKAFVGCANGFGEMSRMMHRFTLKHVLPKQFAEKPLPVLYNSWEATGFGVNAEGQKLLAKRAKEAGVELFVMDDGWFGERSIDKAGLGDWYVNEEKFPNGIDELIECVNGYGMEFGLWFEPEMVNPDSDLFRKHPEWTYHYETREAHEHRNQLVLNLTLPEVQQHVFDSVDRMLSKHNIKYVKWDHNRSFSEVGAENLECPREAWHRHIQAFYDIVDRLKEKHPEVAFESCAAGGARSDHGAISHFDQVWTSDNTDAVDRMMMQNWFTALRPAKVMRAWVTDTNYYNKPMPLDFKFNIAMQGSLGLGGNLSNYSDEDIAACRRNVELYKEIRHLVQFGDLYRILKPDTDEILFNNFVSYDKREAVAFIATAGTHYMKRAIYLHFDGLDDETVYRFEFDGRTYEKSGAFLKRVGIPATIWNMGYNRIIRIKGIG